jgi:predicted acyltransferase (DUF342 family)
MALTAITKDFIVSSGLTVQGTGTVTTSTLANNGLSVKGGAAFAQDIIVGGKSTLFGATQLNNSLSVLGYSTLTSTLFVGGATTLDNSLSVRNTATLNSDLYVTGFSTLTGTLFVGQGTTLNSTLDVAGNVNVNQGKFTITASNGNVYVNGALGVQGDTSHTGTVTINNLATADSAGLTAALKVKGGALIGDNLAVMSTASSDVVLASNSLYTAGGLGVAKDLLVGGTARITGDLYVDGTQFIVNKEVVATGDSALVLSNLASTAALAAGSGLYIGASSSTAYISFTYDGANDFVSSMGIKATTGTITASTVSVSPTTGALTVTGGVGIGGKLYVGGGIDGTVTTATNIQGGGKGYIPIQSADGKTAFIPAPSMAGALLTWDNANSTATWISASASVPDFARYAGTATNIAGGAQYDIPFQSATSSTTFDTGLFQYNNTDYTLKVYNAVLYTDGGSPGDATATVSLVNTSTGGTELFSTDFVQLNYDNTNYVYANAGGATLEVGATTLTLNTAGNVTLSGSGTFTAPFVKPGNLTSGRITYYNGTSLVDHTGLTYNGSGSLTVSTALNVSGSGGNITMTQGDITGVKNISSSGIVSATTGSFTDVTSTGLASLAAVTASQLYVTNTSSSDTIIVRNTLESTSTTASNALYVQGGIGVDGHGYFGKSVRVGDNIIATNQVSGQSGVLFGDAQGFGALYAGTTNYSPLPSTVIQSTAYVNNYAQNNFQNTSTGAIASTDWVATAGDGNDTTHYIDMGIVTANWDGSQSNSLGTAVGASDGYLYVQGSGLGTGGNLVIGASATGTTVKIVAGGIGASYNAAVFRAPNTDATSTTTGSLSVAGGVGIGKGLYVGSTTTIKGTLFVDEDVTINANLNIEGTIFVKGTSLTGIDQITGSTGTFVNIASTGTSSLGDVTVTSSAPTMGAATGGAVAVTGGVGIAKDIYVGTTATVAGDLSVVGNSTMTGTLYVDEDVTINADLYVEGTIFVKGTSLSGIDSISGSTGTFVDVVSTGTAYLNNVEIGGEFSVYNLKAHDINSTGTTTATNLVATTTFNATAADSRLGNTTATNLVVTTKLDATGGNTYLAGTTATTLNVTGTEPSTSTLTGAVTVAGGVGISGSTNIGGTMYVSNTDDGTFNTYSGQPANGTGVGSSSIGTLGGISAAKGIKAGGIISAGDFAGTGSPAQVLFDLGDTLTYPNGADSGSIDGFYLLNNMQAARTVRVTAETNAIVIDAWDSTIYTSAKYLVQVKTASGIHVEEIMLVQGPGMGPTGPGTNVYMSEYGMIYSTGDALGIFDADYSGSNVQLTFTPSSSLTGTIQVVRQSILTSVESYC